MMHDAVRKSCGSSEAGMKQARGEGGAWRVRSVRWRSHPKTKSRIDVSGTLLREVAEETGW